MSHTFTHKLSHSSFSKTRPLQAIHHSIGYLLSLTLVLLLASCPANAAPFTCNASLTTLGSPVVISTEVSTTAGCSIRGGSLNPTIGNNNEVLLIQVGLPSDAAGGARSVSFASTIFTNVQLAINSSDTAGALSGTPLLFTMVDCQFSIANRPNWSYGIVFMGRTLPYGSQITFRNNQFIFGATLNPGFSTFTGIDFIVTNWVSGSRLEVSSCTFSNHNITVATDQGLVLAVSMNIFASFAPSTPANPTAMVSDAKIILSNNVFEATNILKQSASFTGISLTLAFLYLFMPLDISTGGSLVVDGLQMGVAAPLDSAFSFVTASALHAASDSLINVTNGGSIAIISSDAVINNTATAALGRFEGGVAVTSNGILSVESSSLDQSLSLGWNSSSCRSALLLFDDKSVSISTSGQVAVSGSSIISTNLGVSPTIRAETIVALTLFLKMTGVGLNNNGSLTLVGSTLSSRGLTTGIPQNLGGSVYAFRVGIFFYTSPVTLLGEGSTVTSLENRITVESLRPVTGTSNTGADIIAASVAFFSNSPLSMGASSTVVVEGDVVNATVKGMYSTMVNFIFLESSLPTVTGNGTTIRIASSRLSMMARTAGTFGPYDLSRSASGTVDTIAFGVRKTQTVTFQDYAQLAISNNTVMRDSSFVSDSVVTLFAAVVFGNVLFNGGAGATFDGNRMALSVGGASTGSSSVEYVSTFIFGGTILRVQSSGKIIFNANTLHMGLIDGGVGKASNVGTLKLSVSCLTSPTSGTTLNMFSGAFITFSGNTMVADAESTIVAMNLLQLASTTISFTPPSLPPLQYTTMYDAAGSPPIIFSHNSLSLTLSTFQSQQQQSINTIASLADFTGATLTPSQAYAFGSYLVGTCRNYLNNWLRADIIGAPSAQASVAAAPQCYTRTLTSTFAVATVSDQLTLSNAITPTGGWKPPRTDSTTHSKSISWSGAMSKTKGISASRSETLIVGCPSSCANVSILGADGQSLPVGRPCPSMLGNSTSSVAYDVWSASVYSSSGTNGTVIEVTLTVAWASRAVPMSIIPSNSSVLASRNQSFSKVKSFSAKVNSTLGSTVARVVFQVTYSDGVGYAFRKESTVLMADMQFGCTDASQSEYPQRLPIEVTLLPKVAAPTSTVPALDPSVGDAGGVGSVIGIVGGGAAAADMQTLALLGLSACSQSTTDSKARPKTTGLALRLLAPTAIEDSCEGAIVGNFILVGGVALLQLIASLVFSKAQGKSLAAAMDTTRFPSLTLVILLFLQNGFFLCGFDVIRNEGSMAVLGYVGVAWTVMPILLFLFISFRLASRAFYPIVYRLKSPWDKPAKLVLPHGQLDSSVLGTEMFSTVVGTFQHPHRGLVMCHFLGFIASAPIVIGIGDTCEPMYILAIALHVVFAVAVAAIRPHRVMLNNILQPFCLGCNAIIIIHYLLVLKNPDSIPRDLSVSLQIVAVTQTVFTAMRTVQSLLQIGVAIAARKWRSLAPYPLSCAWEVANWPGTQKGASTFNNVGFFREGAAKDLDVEGLLEMGVAGAYKDETWVDCECSDDISSDSSFEKELPSCPKIPTTKNSTHNETTTPHFLPPNMTDFYFMAMQDPLLGSGTAAQPIKKSSDEMNPKYAPPQKVPPRTSSPSVVPPARTSNNNNTNPK